MTSQQLVEHRAKAVYIRRARELGVVSHGLFWRHVARRAQHFHRSRDSALRLDQSCQPVVGEMRFTFLMKQNVSLVDVTMNDAVLGCVMNGPLDRSVQCDRVWD